jgi:hypothetical protein
MLFNHECDNPQSSCRIRYNYKPFHHEGENKKGKYFYASPELRHVECLEPLDVVVQSVNLTV